MGGKPYLLASKDETGHRLQFSDAETTFFIGSATRLEDGYFHAFVFERKVGKIAEDHPNLHDEIWNLITES